MSGVHSLEEVWVGLPDRESIRSELVGERLCYFTLKKLTRGECTLEEIENYLEDVPHSARFVDAIDSLKSSGAVVLRHPNIVISDAGRRWHTHLRQINTDSWEKHIEVVHGYMTIPQRFLEELKNRAALLDKITLVSPWVADESLVLSLVSTLQNGDTPQIRVLRTRSRSDRRPDQHRKCVEALSKAGFDVKYLDDLHAKVYLGLSYRNPSDSFAMVSSANLTEDSVFDVAVLISGATDDLLDTIFNLDSLFAYS